MTQPWWGKEAAPDDDARFTTARATPYGRQPELLPATRRAVADEVRARIKNFTPEWTNFRTTDAGAALVLLFGEQMEPVLQRLNLLPQKSLVEFLILAGVSPLPATPAEALLQFTVSAGARQSVLVPVGFQVGARPATGEGDLVIFETDSNLYAAPAEIAAAFVQEGSLYSEVKADGKGGPFSAFGGKPIPGRALYLGLSGDVTPSPFLSLGVGVASATGVPAPVASGGGAGVQVTSRPTLRWEIQDGAGFEPAEVVRDETDGLARSGVVELRLPRQWRKGKLQGEDGEEELRWLRLRIIYGQYERSPLLSFVKLNMVRAAAARTIRNEVLEYVPNSGNRQMRLSQTPVIPGSVILEVDDAGLASPLEGELAAGQGRQTTDATRPRGRRWREVESLLDFGPDALVFVLDPASGVLTFGDNVHGAAVPPGFRNVVAVSYRVSGGAAGAVKADAIKTLLSSAPFVTGATNPLSASGGANGESQQHALVRGPQEFRARGRAVTTADYALLAMRAPGAQVERAYAVSGLHPSLPGRPIPGVVGVYVLPPDRGEGPPTPDEATLRAVAAFLSDKLAPAGVQVVAAAPRFHSIRAEASVVIARGADASETVRLVLDELDHYLHPLKGGDDGRGWPFGGTLKYASLVRVLLANVAGLLAVPRLTLVIDGTRARGCEDIKPAPYALFWPEAHEVIALEEGEVDV